MRIAILGAGFSGLSAAWNLLKIIDCEISIFDGKGIGGGASGIAAGLMHPYVGEEGKRSLLATEGMAASEELITAVEEKLYRDRLKSSRFDRVKAPGLRFPQVGPMFSNMDPLAGTQPRELSRSQNGYFSTDRGRGEKIANRDGILRYMVTEEQNQRFLDHCKQYDDVEPHGDRCFLIKSGMTIDCPRYLGGLWEVLSSLGVKLIREEVSCLQSLKGFDHIIVAAGAGIAKFPELSHLRFFTLKGQVLICQAPDSLTLPLKSSIYKGYVALSGRKGECHIGSTYERSFSDDLPNLKLAKEELFLKIAPLIPEVEQLRVVSCTAALRVIRRGHYFPIIAKVRDGLWAFGAMGSRGLLYHAFAGKLLADAVATNDDPRIIMDRILSSTVSSGVS